MKSNYQTEVLVVGGGPVGMFTALLLGQNGIQTRIIDQESRTAAHSYACALHPLSLEFLDRAGIAEEAVELGWVVDSIGIYEGAKPRCGLSLSALPTKFPFAVVLPQCDLEDLLERRLRLLPEARLQWNRRLADLQLTEQSVNATVERLAYTAKGYIVPDFEMGVEGQYSIHADFVVGADGHDSIVRQRLNIPRETAGDRDAFAVFECETDERLNHEMKIVLDQGLVSVLWPMARNRCRWSFQLALADASGDFPDKNRDRIVIDQPRGSEARSRLDGFLRERAPWFHGKITGLNWTTDIQFEHWVASQFGRGRVWLVGDAAHQTCPVAVQSMNLGLAEAADLAAHLEQILRHQASPDILKTYDQTHQTAWQSLLGLNGGASPGGETPTWMKRYSPQIAGYLPASGDDLAQLLARLGFGFIESASRSYSI